jgi:hypothetical protein
MKMDDQYSKSARDLMDAMENGAFSMQQIAEAFAAMDDDALEELGKLLRERHREPMVPRQPTKSIDGAES